MSQPDGAADALRQEAARAARAIVDSKILRGLLETTGAIDEAWWRHCREQGFTAIGIPEAYGGIGLGLGELCVLAEIGGGIASGVPLLETGYAAAQAILRHGDEAMRETMLPRLAAGEASILLSIVEGNAPLPAMPGLAWADGAIDGERAAVPAGGVADYAVLTVTVAGGGDAAGLALVDLRGDGVRRHLPNTFDNSRCAAGLVFRQASATLLAPLPPDAIADLLDVQAVLAAHQQLGGAAAMLALARDHALHRVAFGQKIGAFQSVKHRIAEGYVLVELARAGAEEAVAAAGTPGFGRAAMAARLLATEAYETLTRDAVQVHGGIGVTWEADLHLHQRRARSLALELGPAMAWEDRLADALAASA